MMRFFKSNGFRCVLVLMVVTIVCCGLLAALRTPLYVSSEPRASSKRSTAKSWTTTISA